MLFKRTKNHYIAKCTVSSYLKRRDGLGRIFFEETI